MKRILVLLLALPLVVLGQKVDVESLKNMKMRNVGPAGMSGRVTSIDALVSDPSTIYIGTASGGLWRSTSGGTDWHPLFDKQPMQSIGAVAVDQNNPDVIWAGTGEGNPRNSHNSGGGIFKSIDGGHSWKMMGLAESKTIHRIIIDNNDNNIVYAAAMGSAWGPNKERGVFKTTDGGKNWKKVLYINDSTGCADLIVDPVNPNKLIAAMWQYYRTPWFFESGGKGSGMYISFDGGETWEQRTEKDGLPKGTLGRMGLAVCYTQPNVVYALVEAKKTGLYRSNDGGFKWHLVSEKNIGNRPFYYADIYVDPVNENRLYNLYSLVDVSEDGGKTFTTLLPYSGVHPDHHAFWINPKNPSHLIDGNDGGLNISYDKGKTWRFIENLPLAQFYHINIDNDVPYNIYGGMQDNGSWKGPAYVWNYSGIRNDEWREMVFGDGFDVVPDPENSRYGYAMYQGGNVFYYDSETGYTRSVKPVHPEGKPLRFNWNAAISIDPHHSKGVYFGSQYLHYSADQGKSWSILSGDLTTNDTSKQKQVLSGGLTIDATQAENFTTILCIAPSSFDKNVIWVGTDDGNLQKTIDGGKTWNNISSRLPEFPKGAWIPQIELSKVNKNEVFVVVNDYRRNNWKPYIYHSRDGGATFARIVNENKVKGFCLSIVQDPITPDLLFLGTDNGLFVSIDHGKNWAAWTNDYPAVMTSDLKIHPREPDLIVGTFGRAAWVLDDLEPLRQLARDKKSAYTADLKMFTPPEAYLSVYNSPRGVRFAADAVYQGANRPGGARLSYFIKDPDQKKKGDSTETEKKDDSSKKDKKVTVRIFDSNGDTLRTFTTKPDTGINRITWNLRSDGVHGISYSDPKPDADKPSGWSVEPGVYKVKVYFMDWVDSSEVRVLDDPRIPMAASDRDALKKAQEEMDEMLIRSRDAFNQLKDMDKMVADINSRLAQLPDTVQKEIKKRGKSITDSTSKLYLEFVNAKDFEGYDHVSIRLNNHLSSVRGSLYERQAPGANVINAMQITEKEVERIVGTINAFRDTKWEEYQSYVRGITLDPFKELKRIE